MHGPRLVALALLPALLVPRAAWAGDVDPPSSVTVHEEPIALRLVLGTSIARGVMVRRVTNVDHEVGEGVLDVGLPVGAAATGLRTFMPGAGGNEDERAFAAVLLGKGSALSTYARSERTIGAPGADAALLEWVRERSLDLRVQPLLPDVMKHVEVDFEAPLDYREGAAHLALEPDVDASSLELWAADPEDELLVDGRVVPAGVRVTLIDPIDVAVRRRAAPPVEVREVAIHLRSGRVVSNLEVRVADPLSYAPRGARVVIALDASRSIADPRRLIAAAKAYLGEMPDAEVAAMAFARKARPLWQGFVSVDEAVRRLDAAPIARENGSEVGAALALADADF